MIFSKDEFWINNPSIYFQDQNYLKFIPTSDMSRVQQLNAISLLCLYSFALILIFHGLSNWLYVPIVVLILVIILYYINIGDSEAGQKEFFRQKNISNENNNNGNNNDNNNDDNVIVESGYYDADGILRLGQVYDATTIVDNKKVVFTMDEMDLYENNARRKPTPNNPFMNTPVTEYNKEGIPAASNADDDEIKEEIDKNFYVNLYRDVGDLYGVKNSQRMYYTTPPIPSEQHNFAKWLYSEKENCKVNQFDCLETDNLLFRRHHL